MSFSEWREVKLKEIIDFNPRESLSKGEIAKKIPMENIEPFKKKISGFEEVEYKGGTKFRNGDTLLARITPSLENGKTAKVDILNEDEVAFGSTEFIVLRAKDNLTTEDYVYYLAISDYIRDIAIKSMTGTSGRQRAQTDVIEDTIITLPTLKEQKEIAYILSTLDEKIEVNNRINKTLEEIAQAIFKHWFVDFEFPNEDGEPYKSSGGEMVNSELGPIPKGWEVTNIKEYSEFMANGGTPKRNNDKYWDKREVPWLKTTEISDGLIIDAEEWISQEGFKNSSAKLFPIDTVLVAMYGVTAGKLGLLRFESTTNQACCGITCSESKSPYYLYLFLRKNQNELKSLARGSAQQNLSKGVIERFNIILPMEELLSKFHTISKSIFRQIENKKRMNTKLESIRDTLLPKLMSGEIRVPLDDEE